MPNNFSAKRFRKRFLAEGCAEWIYLEEYTKNVARPRSRRKFRKVARKSACQVRCHVMYDLCRETLRCMRGETAPLAVKC